MTDPMMTAWPWGPIDLPEMLGLREPPEQQNSLPGPEGGYQQPWGTSHQAPGTAADYQQSPNQFASQGPSAQPWGQPAGPSGAAPGWQTGALKLGLDVLTPRKSRKGLLITVAVAALVALVAGLAFVGYRVTTGDGFGARSALSPGQTVQQYLEALAAGDAQKALSFGASQPASTELLTNEILAQQNAAMPITNIRILNQVDVGAFTRNATVHVAVNFGDVVDDAQLRVIKDTKGVWKLASAAVKIEPPPGVTSNEGPDTVTVFGKPLNKGALYVFPGYLDLGSSNDYLKVSAEALLLDDISAYGFSSQLRPEITLSDAGSDAVKQAVAEEFASCAASSQLNPPGCPTRVSEYDARGAVEGTVSWGQTDLSGLTLGKLSPYSMIVWIRGNAATPVSYQTADGQTKSGTVTTYVARQADITTTPPTIKGY